MNSSNENINNSKTFKSINTALELLKSGKFDEALNSFSLILKENYSNLTAESGIKCCKYWISRADKIFEIEDNFERGRELFEEWKKFEKFAKSLKNIQQRVISSIMYFIFSSALESFKNEINEDKILDFNTLFMIALSYKRIGDFKNAEKYFKEAIKLEYNNSNAIAQLADCYALIDDEKKAKVLFREAFFIEPDTIDLELLDSNIITYLTTKLLESDIQKNDINFWLPVYARALGIFIIYRDLIPSELIKLRKEILILEKCFEESLNKDNIAKAKLLNHYFWLYDHINLKNKDKGELKEIEFKIKNISEQIYEIFNENIKKYQEIK